MDRIKGDEERRRKSLAHGLFITGAETPHEVQGSDTFGWRRWPALDLGFDHFDDSHFGFDLEVEIHGWA